MSYSNANPPPVPSRAPNYPPPLPPGQSKLMDAPYVIYSNAKSIDATSVSKRTLIISTHGAYLSAEFPLPSWTHVMFCTPKDSALRANLADAISGSVGGVGMPTGTKNCADFSLTHFEKDPPENEIFQSIRGNDAFDVLVLLPNGAVQLSDLVAWLKAKDLKYPRLQGLFCRVDSTGQQGYYSFTGKTSVTTEIVHQSKFKAQLIANELKGLKKTS